MATAFDVFRNLSQKYRGNDVSTISSRTKLLSDTDSSVKKLVDTNQQSIILAGVPGSAKTLRFLVAQDSIARKRSEHVLPIYVDCMEVIKSVPKYEQFLASVESQNTEEAQRLFEADIVFRLIKSMTASAKAYADRHRKKTVVLDWLLGNTFIKTLETEIQSWIEDVEKKRGDAGGLAVVTNRSVGKENLQNQSSKTLDHDSSTVQKVSTDLELSANGSGKIESQAATASAGLTAQTANRRSFEEMKSQSIGRSRSWESDLSEEKDFMRLYHQHADLLIRQFLEVLASNSVETVIFFFDEFSEATFGGREFVGRIIKAISSCTTEKQIRRCIRIAAYPGDVDRARTLVEGTVVSFVDPLSSTSTRRVLSTEDVELEGGRHLKTVFQKAFEAARVPFDTVFDYSGTDEDTLFRNLHIFGGGSVRIIARYLSSLEERDLPVSLKLLQSLSAGWLDEHISRAGSLVVKRAGLQLAEEHAETADAGLRVQFINFASRVFREFAINFDESGAASTRFLFFPKSFFYAEGLEAALEYGLCYLLGSVHSTEHREPVLVVGISSCFFNNPDNLNYHVTVSGEDIGQLARDSWYRYEIARFCVSEEIEEESS